MRIARIFVLPLLGIALLAAPAAARVVRVEILTRSDIAGAFGNAGTYERITGRVYFAFDPNNPENRKIVDLDLAPRNSAGEVEAVSEFVMLRPKDLARSADLAVIDIVNRGGITTFIFNLGRNGAASPQSAEFYGDALLMKRGVTIVALAWQWDVPPGGSALHFQAPPAGSAERPITGLVRSDITIDSATTSIPLGHSLAPTLAYPVADENDPSNVLTVRDDPVGPRTVVPRSEWRFARDSSGTVVSDPRWVYMSGGFAPGRIYEVVYRAKDPVVVGAGLAAVRDMMSYLKYDPSAVAHVRYGIGYGVSQTGRFIRHFLYQGFNTDEKGRVAFDGFFAHTAGAGRGSFNHRFAQPSRDAQPYSTFFYPTDVFPFTSVPTLDSVTGRRAGFRDDLRGSGATRIFYVDGGHEYWGRAASLSHTTPDGKQDVGFLPTERRYVISSAQHSSPGAWPVSENARISGTNAYRGDPLDQRLALRALMSSLIDWVEEGKEPPPSLYPTLAGGKFGEGRGRALSRDPQSPGCARPASTIQARLRAKMAAWNHRRRATEGGRAIPCPRVAGGFDRQRSRRNQEHRAARAARHVLSVAAQNRHGRGNRPAPQLSRDLCAASKDRRRARNLRRFASERPVALQRSNAIHAASGCGHIITHQAAIPAAGGFRRRANPDERRLGTVRGYREIVVLQTATATTTEREGSYKLSSS